jgi:hypothetical protein
LPVDEAARLARNDEEARGEAGDRKEKKASLITNSTCRHFRHRDRQSGNRPLPPMEIGVSILMSAFLLASRDGIVDRSGKVRKMSAPVGGYPRSVGRRLVRADFCHVKKGVGRRLFEPQRSQSFKRGSRRR